MELDRQHQQQQQRHEVKDASSSSDSEAAPVNDRQSSLLRTIPENEDTDDETLANYTDAATAFEHVCNLFTHIDSDEDWYTRPALCGRRTGHGRGAAAAAE